jgi:hypothetical protein
MLRGLVLVITSTFFIAVYLTIVAPAIDQVSNEVQAVDQTGGIAIYQTLETVLFVGLPLIFVGGILVVVFVISAGGRRGTSR